MREVDENVRNGREIGMIVKNGREIGRSIVKGVNHNRAESHHRRGALTRFFTPFFYALFTITATEGRKERSVWVGKTREKIQPTIGN